MTQWNNPCPGDWTEQVKADLVDLKINMDLQTIKKKSKTWFKNMVRIKVKEYALEGLLDKKQTHSKMKNIYYNELKMQSYLKNPKNSTEQARNIFKFRTHMAEFGENYRGGGGPSMCPLCSTHLDNQSMSIQCLSLKENVNFDRTIEDVYKEEVDEETSQLVQKIMKIREKMLN